MRPDSGASIDQSSSFECGVTPSELIQSIGLLIFEGRIPELSSKGRYEGVHCWPLACDGKQPCCKTKGDSHNKSSMCGYASIGRLSIQSTWEKSTKFIVNVAVDQVCIPSSVSPQQRLHYQNDFKKKGLVLIEQWEIEVQTCRKSAAHSSIQMLFQALRSFLHFSQLSAWWTSSHGSSPANVHFSIDESTDTKSCEFTTVPDVHIFPLTMISLDLAIKITVLSLPRINFNKICLEETTPERDTICKASKIASNDLHPKACRSLFTSNEQFNNVFQCSNKSNTQIKIKDNGYTTHYNTSSSSSTRCHTASQLSDAVDRMCVNKDCSSSVENGNNLSNIDRANQILKTESKIPDETLNDVLTRRSPSSQCQDDHMHRYPDYCKCGSKSRRATIAVPRAHHSKRRTIRDCTLPIFNPKTGLPVSSSPAPYRKPDTCSEIEHGFNDFCDISREGLSPDCCCGADVELEPNENLLSRSAPASTGLLGNFEESVLKGRMPADGTVSGFTINLGASGSFCPHHVTLPVRAHFYRLSEDGMPSPYMGCISLKDPRVGRKGYHVPRKGTIQLTLFNPNMTVVKVFVVLYDHQDMPHDSHTFLRQKIVSCRYDVVNQEEQRSLHYLIHLRFVSSKKGRIYLHSDIRLLFPRQPPDINSFGLLQTISDEPKNPRYS